MGRICPSASSLHVSYEIPGNMVVGNRGVAEDGEAFVGHVIDDFQEAEPPAIGHLARAS